MISSTVEPSTLSTYDSNLSKVSEIVQKEFDKPFLPLIDFDFAIAAFSFI